MADHDAPQNVYDDPAFFAGYAELRRNESGLNAVLEQPALRRLLPPLRDLRVLDLGTGFGTFARWAREQGARRVVGVDVSTRMLAEARRLTADPAIEYVESAIETYAPERGAFDLVTSSLALHYVADYPAVVARVREALAPGGRFVFSVEHPMVTARAAQDWVRDEAGRKVFWPVDEYGTEGRRETYWFRDGVIRHHRTVATYVNALLAGGFALTALTEPGPTAEALAARPELESELRRPPFLLIAAMRLRDTACG
jgi:SAM-dependent methyltransferase